MNCTEKKRLFVLERSYPGTVESSKFVALFAMQKPVCPACCEERWNVLMVGSHTERVFSISVKHEKMGMEYELRRVEVE